MNVGISKQNLFHVMLSTQISVNYDITMLINGDGQLSLVIPLCIPRRDKAPPFSRKDREKEGNQGTLLLM